MRLKTIWKTSKKVLTNTNKHDIIYISNEREVKSHERIKRDYRRD